MQKNTETVPTVNDMEINRHKAYYNKHKDEAWFKERNRVRAKKYRNTNPDYKAYHKEYCKKYYVENKEKLNKARKNYPDPTRNERVNMFKKRERDNLGDRYIIAILVRRGKVQKDDITPEMIEQRRQRIFMKRTLRGIKS